MIRRPPRSTPFPTRRSSDLCDSAERSSSRLSAKRARRQSGSSGVVGAWPPAAAMRFSARSEEHTSELQSRRDLVCRLLLEKKKNKKQNTKKHRNNKLRIIVY